MCPLEELSSEKKAMLFGAKIQLKQARMKRARPFTDDKILVSWNGLMISGLIWAGRVLHLESEDVSNPALKVLADRVTGSALRAFEKIGNLPIPPNSPYASTLPATIQKGAPKGNGFLDDYAFMARAALDLHRFGYSNLAGQSPLDWAVLWMNRVLESFRDSTGDPGYFFTGDDHEKLLQRPKSLYDQAIPSGTAVACGNFVALSELLEPGERHPIATIEKFRQEASTVIASLAPHLRKNPYGHGELASAVRLFTEGLMIFSGNRSLECVSGDRDFAPLGSDTEFRVCSRGVCQSFENLEGWARKS
jgi:uncharacterized protein YyaL (SSP411 family)